MIGKGVKHTKQIEYALSANVVQCCTMVGLLGVCFTSHIMTGCQTSLCGKLLLPNIQKLFQILSFQHKICWSVDANLFLVKLDR